VGDFRMEFTNINILFLICILILGILFIINIITKLNSYKIIISFIGILIFSLLYFFLGKRIDKFLLYYILTFMLIFLFIFQINWKKLQKRDIYYISFMILGIIFIIILKLNIYIPIWVLKILPTIFISIAIIGAIFILIGKI